MRISIQRKINAIDRETRSSHPGKWLGVVAACVLLVGCGGGSDGDEVQGDVNATMRDLPDWGTFSPLHADEDAESIEPIPPENLPPQPEIVGDNAYTCTYTPYDITRTPREIVIFSPNASVMWLGNLIQGRGYKEGLGSFEELSIRERAPLKISIDLLTAENSRVVENPSLTTVQSAIGELIQLATESGLVGSSDATYTEELTHSTKETALKLGISGKYMGFSASADLAYNGSADERTLTAYFYQKVFTASVELPSTPANFFSNAFTQEKLDEAVAMGDIASDNLPVYIANVAYGRVLMYTFTSTHSEERMRAAITGSYQGITNSIEGYSSAELSETLSTAKISVTALGGNNDSVEALIREGNLRSYFVGDTALTAARPISYQLNNLGDNSIAKVSETTRYSIRTCEAPVSTTVATGEKYRVTLNEVYIGDDCADLAAGDVYGHFKINDHSVFNIPEDKTVTKGSGSTLAIEKHLDIDYLYGKSNIVNISGRLLDDDDNGDDNIGTWDYDLPLIHKFEANFDFSYLGSKIYGLPGSNHCGTASWLHFKIRRMEYIYPL